MLIKQDVQVDNFFQFEKEKDIFKVIRITEIDIRSNFFWRMFEAGRLLPIELNPQWFLDFGFDADQDRNLSFAMMDKNPESPSTKISFGWSPSEGITIVNGLYSIDSVKRKRYVHQLQQMYYALICEPLVNNKVY